METGFKGTLFINRNCLFYKHHNLLLIQYYLGPKRDHVRICSGPRCIVQGVHSKTLWVLLIPSYILLHRYSLLILSVSPHSLRPLSLEAFSSPLVIFDLPLFWLDLSRDSDIYKAMLQVSFWDSWRFLTLKILVHCNTKNTS